MFLAHHLWEQTFRADVANLETFENALAVALRETSEAFEKGWDDLADKPNHRKVLAALANSEETLYNRRTLKAYGLEKGGADSAVRALIDRGDAQRVDGGFMLVDPLLEQWLQHTQR